MKEYKHTQIGYTVIVALGVVIAMLGVIIVTLSVVTVLVSNLTFIPNFNLVAILLLSFTVLCLALFATLTVEVDDQAIHLRFGIGVIRKRFLLKEIETHQPVKNPWHYGWGIHWIPNGLIFNVSGWEAVELQMKNGRKYRIGTDDVHGLANAIEFHTQKI
jgi:hypothetical protein